MKTTELMPDQWLYTERMNTVDDDETVAQLRKDRTSPGHVGVPIYAVPYDASKHQYILYNGNHQALLAEWERRSLTVNVIENSADFHQAEADQPVDWVGTSSLGDSPSLESDYPGALVAMRRAADHVVRCRQPKMRAETGG